MKYVVMLLGLCSVAVGQPVATNTGVTQAAVCSNASGGGTSVSPYPTYPFHTICQATFLVTWSSCAVDTKRNRVVCLGGGHSDYHGNEVYAYYYVPGASVPCGTAPCWEEVTPPSVFCNIGISGNTDTTTGCGGLSTGIGNSSCSNTSPQNCWYNQDNTPVANHPFGGVVYLPNQDALYSYTGTFPSGSDRDFTWLLGFTGNGISPNATWAPQEPVNGSSPLSSAQSSSGAVAIYDSTIDAVDSVKVTSGLVYQYVPSTNTYSIINNQNGWSTSNGMFGALDPIHHYLWFMGEGATAVFQAGYINLGASGDPFVDVSSSLVGTCAGMFNSQTAWPGFEWDPVSSVFVGYSGSTGGGGGGLQTMYKFDPIALQCSSYVIAGATMPPIPTASPYGIWGKLRYLPQLPGNFFYNPPDGSQDTIQLLVDAPVGLGHSYVTNASGACLDVDGDGYGVGPACLGPDADDNDVTVHTEAQAAAKWGSLNAFLAYQQYNTSRVWTISTTGNDGTCTVNGSACATFAHVVASETAGDLVLVHGGTYTSNTLTPGSGTSTAQNVWMAYPGELPIIDGGGNVGVDMTGGKSYITIRGFKVENGLGSVGCIGGGNVTTGLVVIYNDVTNCNPGGIAIFDGLTNVVVMYNVSHDNTNGQHGIYMGSRTNVSSNVRVSMNIIYNPAQYPGIQWNGRVINLFMEQNMVYNVSQASCYSWEDGVSSSFFRDNVCFNSAEGFQIINYDGDCYNGGSSTGICPYNQTGNLVANNTLPVGAVDSGNVATILPGLIVDNLTSGCPPGYNSGASYSIGDTVISPYQTTGATIYTALAAGVLTTPPSSDWTTGSVCNMSKVGNIGGNTFRSNIFVNNNGGTNNYSPASFPMCTLASELTPPCALDTGETTLATSVFQSNIFWSTGGGSSGAISTGPNPGFGYTSHTCSALGSLTTITNCVNSSPSFVAYDPSTFYTTPAAFNLRLASGSPGLNTGMSLLAPAVDVAGNPTPSVPTLPNMGAFATASQASPNTPASVVGPKSVLSPKSVGH